MSYSPHCSRLSALLAVWLMACCLSCNKDFEAPPPPAANNSGQTIDQIIQAGAQYTILKAALAKAGMDSVLNTAGNNLTLFAPDDSAFALSGITPATIQVLSATQLNELISYHIIPNAIASSVISDSFPNTQFPTLLPLDPSNLLVKMSVFPWKSPGGPVYANNIPVTGTDQIASNGVIHNIAAVLNPPSALLSQIISSDTSLTFFSAAIARADSGQVGLDRIDSLLNYPLVNMTVLAPNNQAFQTILYEEIYAILLQQGVPSGTAAAEANALSSSPDLFTNPALYGVLTAATVRGIVVYHVLAVESAGAFQPLDRAFSVNFPTVPGSFVTTLVNSAYPTHPGIEALASFTGPVVSSLQFTGLGTFPPGGTPYSGPPAHAIVMDELGVNGIVHVIDEVLLPQ